MDLAEAATEDVEAHERGHVDDVLRGAEHRGVAQLDALEVLERAAHGDEGGDNVHTLRDVAATYGLHPQKLAGGHLEDQLEAHVVATGHETDLVGRVHQDGVEGVAGGAGRPLVEAVQAAFCEKTWMQEEPMNPALREGMPYILSAAARAAHWAGPARASLPGRWARAS